MTSTGRTGNAVPTGNPAVTDVVSPPSSEECGAVYEAACGDKVSKLRRLLGRRGERRERLLAAETDGDTPLFGALSQGHPGAWHCVEHLVLECDAHLAQVRDSLH